MQLDFGMEVKEVDARQHISILVTTLGLTCNTMHSGRQGLPKASFLVLVLSLTIWNRDHAPEEEVWGTLSRMWLCAEGEHCVFGESRELLPHMWLREGNLEYQQLPDSHLACYEFLWGPQVYAETSKWQFMAFLLRVKQRALRAFPPLSAEAAREEDEAA